MITHFKDYLYEWKTENMRDFEIGNDRFISVQCYKATLINTQSIPEFIRWALDEAHFAYILTNRLNTDKVETLHAELRQAGGDRRNVTVADVMHAIPQIALAKQSLKAVSVKGANVDPNVAPDPDLSSRAGYAQRLASAPKLPSRPRHIPSAPPLPPPFKPQYFFGRVCRRLDSEALLTPQEIETRTQKAKDDKVFKDSKAFFKAEFAFESQGQLKIYEMKDKKLKEVKVLVITLGVDGDAFFNGVTPTVPIGSPRVLLLHCKHSTANQRPYVYFFLKLQPTAIDAFKDALSVLLTQ